METISEAVVVAPLTPIPIPQPDQDIKKWEGTTVLRAEIPEPSKIQSEEAQAVVSITEEYARSCDSHKQALDAVSNTRQHIDKMGLVLNELLADEDKKKKLKDELKRKVLETLAMGGE